MASVAPINPLRAGSESPFYADMSCMRMNRVSSPLAVEAMDGVANNYGAHVDIDIVSELVNWPKYVRLRGMVTGRQDSKFRATLPHWQSGNKAGSSRTRECGDLAPFFKTMDA
ncbi:hypothetical protein GMDG_02589 [Pseudogymnoascus destructans 20631-21]|uniref:Uncharacterized protein n=1 Tax=Pseudogymnoascus destructans (strain ATCC MYA-4855 / 20631-21) TaxID=658429 RepID=L8G2Y2_PSED2|nr:hypothetical protein GMDG_02589 [Pseudogymnoascus destructans 20631-21]